MMLKLIRYLSQFKTFFFKRFGSSIPAKHDTYQNLQNYTILSASNNTDFKFSKNFFSNSLCTRDFFDMALAQKLAQKLAQELAQNWKMCLKKIVSQNSSPVYVYYNLHKF